MKYSFAFLLALSLLVCTFSCKNDDNGGPGSGCNSIAFNERFASEVTAVSNASAAYSADPTPANCQNFKNAYSAYIDALETYETCAIALNQRAEWQQAIDGARASINAIVC